MIDVAFEDAILALQANWDDVMARLDAGLRDNLARLLDALDGPGRPEVRREISDFLVETLPRDHPVRRALIGGTLFAPADLDWAAVTRNLHELSAAGVLNLAGWGGTVLQDVTDRLLRQPALGPPELRDLGVDPDDPDLIRLSRADGRYQWPRFQFAPDGPVPVPEVVRTVNEILDGRADPIGAADWWLSRNGWLGESPSRLLGEIPDDLLIQAARAIGV